MRNAYNRYRHPNAKPADKRDSGSGYIESPAKMEKALQAALEANRLRLAEQRAALVKKHRLRGKQD